MTSRSRAATRGFATFLFLVASFVALATGPAASAHGDEAAVSVVSATPDGDAAVHYRIRIVFQNDGDPVPGAFPVAVASSAGVDQPSVSLAPIGGAAGEYEATVPLPGPGPWTVRFEVSDPEGSLVVDDVVPSTTAPTTAASTTTVAPATSTTTAEDAESESTSPVSATDIATDSETGSDPDDDGAPVGLIVGIVAVGALLAGGGAVMARRRRD